MIIEMPNHPHPPPWTSKMMAQPDGCFNSVTCITSKARNTKQNWVLIELLSDILFYVTKKDILSMPNRKQLHHAKISSPSDVLLALNFCLVVTFISQVPMHEYWCRGMKYWSNDSYFAFRKGKNQKGGWAQYIFCFKPHN